MREAIVMLSRVGALVPLVLSELCVLCYLILTPLFFRSGNRPYGFLCGVLIVSVIFGFSLFKVFRHRLATGLAASVSVVWLVLGLQVLYDCRMHPEKYVYNDACEAVIFLVPLGAIGVICWLILFFFRQQSQSSPSHT